MRNKRRHCVLVVGQSVVYFDPLKPENLEKLLIVNSTLEWERGETETLRCLDSNGILEYWYYLYLRPLVNLVL